MVKTSARETINNNVITGASSDKNKVRNKSKDKENGREDVCHAAPRWISGNSHEYEADRHVRMLLRCRYCGKGKACKKRNVGFYNEGRLKVGQRLNLLCISAPLDDESTTFLQNTIHDMDIDSNGIFPHVMFLEGLLSHQPHQPHLLQEAVEELRVALCENPKLKMGEVKSSNLRDEHTIIYVNVMVSPKVQHILERMEASENCYLPQYPMKVNLGIVPKERTESLLADINQLLKNKTFGVNLEYLNVTPLIDYETSVLEKQDSFMEPPTPSINTNITAAPPDLVCETHHLRDLNGSDQQPIYPGPFNPPDYSCGFPTTPAYSYDYPVPPQYQYGFPPENYPDYSIPSAWNVQSLPTPGSNVLDQDHAHSHSYSNYANGQQMYYQMMFHYHVPNQGTPPLQAASILPVCNDDEASSSYNVSDNDTQE
eukprot:scaffold25330_cov51-Attheya_sp.AAC.2